MVCKYCPINLLLSHLCDMQVLKSVKFILNHTVMYSYSHLVVFLALNSLGRADVTLRHAKGKNRRKYSVRMCVAKRTHRYARHEGEKWDDFPDVRPR